MPNPNLSRGSRRHSGLGPAFADYGAKVLDVQANSLITYWPFSETSGTTADNAEGTAVRDGTYARDVSTMGTGTGIGDGNTAPLFDGANDVVNIYSASLNTAFNGDECTVAGWMRCDNWSDATLRYAVRIYVSGNTYITITKTVTNERLEMLRSGGGIGSTFARAVTTLDWFHVGLTISTGGSIVRGYFNGIPFDDTTTLGTWSGVLDSNLCVLGAATLTPTASWDGGLAHWGIWASALTGRQILSLATPTA